MIKFRAWDKQNNKMLYSGKPWMFVFGIGNTNVIVHDELIQFIIPEEDVMQSLGVRDNTPEGKEIYVGDIIEHTHLVYCGNGIVDEETEIVTVNSIFNSPFDASSVDCKIIGNIYQNPELLEAAE